jgi:ribosomal protein L22
MTFVTKYSYVLSSQKKLALVAKMISGKSITKAVEILTYLPNKAAHTVLKVVKTAVNNAKQAGLETEGLQIIRYDLGQ